MKYMATDALVSADGVYRYWLARRLSMGERSVAFVGLNPSTADATADDATIRKCAGFARRWGFDWLWMLNLHAYRSRDPKNLVKVAREANGLIAVGPENQEHLLTFGLKADLVVCAWGATKLSPYAGQLAALVLNWPHAHVLRWTGARRPEHPLYIPYETALTPAAPSQD
jgi:hypothetical protein